MAVTITVREQVRTERKQDEVWREPDVASSGDHHLLLGKQWGTTGGFSTEWNDLTYLLKPAKGV